MRAILKGLIAVAVLAAATSANANVKWTVSGATFGGGIVSVNGYFTQDAQSNVVDYDLKFTGLDTFEFTPMSAPLTSVGSNVVNIFTGGGETAFLAFDKDLLAVNSPLHLHNAFVVYNGGVFGFYDGPGVATAQVIGAPEPTSWALMLGGLFGAGALLRRRRQAGLAA